MALPLYDVTVARFEQTLGAVEGFLEKGRGWLTENGVTLEEVVEKRLHQDMLPFHFQIVSVAHHSLGAIKGVQAGEFRPPARDGQDYVALQDLVTRTRAELNAYDRETVNALEGGNVTFKLGDKSLPFVAEDFLLSFSLPNFFFHATTAYDILRELGVPLGKRDFLGRLKLKG